MVPYLFRIGRSEDSKRRSYMAQFHGNGQLLSKWSAAHMDRMVRAAFSALVSRRGGCAYAWDGACAGVDAFSAAPVPDYLFLHCDALRTRNHFDGELHVLKLPCAL